MNVCTPARCLVIALTVLTSAAVPTESAASDSLSIDGDLRLRYETVDADGSPQRDRSRLRARLGLTAPISDDLKFVFGIATGSGSPVSTNLTLGSGFSAKDIMLASAYADWQINDEWNLHAGKIKRPWFRPGGSSLIWDADLHPEGVAGHFKRDDYFASLAVLFVEQRSTTDDSLLFSAQAGRNFQLAKQQTLKAGLGYYSYSHTVGNTPFYNGAAAGNSVDLAGNYLNDYRLLELFAEFKTELKGVPFTMFADAVKNTAVSTADTGYAIGMVLGSANESGKSEFAYAWYDTEADAVVGTFNDSSFARGMTDGDGHFIKAKYAIRDNVQLGGTLIVSRYGQFSGMERDYNRVTIDIEFSFE